jgi:hypothetical protein
MGFEVKVNDPYKGVELVRAFSDPASRRHSLQIEVNRRLYMNERTREKSGGFSALSQSITALLEKIAGYAADRGSHRCDASHSHAHCGHEHHHGHHHHDHHHEHPAPAPAAGKES